MGIQQRCARYTGSTVPPIGFLTLVSAPTIALLIFGSLSNLLVPLGTFSTHATCAEKKTRVYYSANPAAEGAAAIPSSASPFAFSAAYLVVLIAGERNHAAKAM